MSEPDNRLNRKTSDDYDAGQIQVLKGLEGVRKRPGMYIGDTDDGTGLHHLVYEVVDNSVDEALAGSLHAHRRHHPLRQLGHRRGQRPRHPVDIHPIENRPAAEVVMTVLHAGGKFGRGGYKVSGGLHGVGVSAVNALSDWLKLEIRRNGKVYYQEYRRGDPATEFKQTGVTDRRRHEDHVPSRPRDLQEHPRVLVRQLAQRLRELAYLNSGLQIIITDERNDQQGTSSSSRAASRRTSRT